MRRIERTEKFKLDYKRERKGRHRAVLGTALVEALSLLANDQALDERYRDHVLAGQWHGHRDCHLRPDLVLIYRKPDPETLQLVRLGSHSELSL